MDWEPSLKILPKPAPRGTVHFCPLLASQLAEMIGAKVNYQPLSKL